MTGSAPTSQPDHGAQLVSDLRSQGLSLATAESLTGGMLGSIVTSVPGASAVFRGGVISYATDVKVDLLGVPKELVDAVGVIDPDVAMHMAQGVARLVDSEIALATTGVAGPDWQDGKPPGTCFIGLYDSRDGATYASALMLTGSRNEIREQVCAQAVLFALDHLSSE